LARKDLREEDDRSDRKLRKIFDNSLGSISANSGRNVGKQAAIMHNPISTMDQYMYVDIITGKNISMENIQHGCQNLRIPCDTE
jgi:hypothetical protein